MSAPQGLLQPEEFINIAEESEVVELIGFGEFLTFEITEYGLMSRAATSARTLEQLQMGSQFAQGHFFSKPVDAAAAEVVLAERRSQQSV
ncbi:MAG: hypothetical protein ACFB5Z_15380 [Elainellaceae cyanobacterium]